MSIILDNMIDDLVSCELCTGIGKQLFQIATVLNYAKRNKKCPVFKNKLNDLVSDSLDVLSDDMLKKRVFRKHEERIENAYNEIPRYNGDIILHGYFQAFQNISKNTLKRMQELIYSDEFYMYQAYGEYNKIKTFFQSEDDDDYVAIHVRRNGSFEHGQLDLQYYRSAYDIMTESGKKQRYCVVFSDDIEWCKQNFKISDQMYFVDIRHACVEFILMSFIKNNIIANSCYSWWATFISNYADKVVIAPKQWYCKRSDRWDDLYPPGWIII
jgi:hypothetical protein